MTLSDELHDLAESLAGAGWQSKPEADWTPDEHRAYHRWATQEIARQDATSGEPIRARDTYDRKTAIGAFLRPTRVTMMIAGDTLTSYSPNQTVIHCYPGINVEDV